MMKLLHSLIPLLDSIVTISLQASVLVCLILAIQALLKNHLSPRWRYALWMILLVRLLLPWTPHSPFSIYNLLPRTVRLQSSDSSRSLETTFQIPTTHDSFAPGSISPAQAPSPSRDGAQNDPASSRIDSRVRTMKDGGESGKPSSLSFVSLLFLVWMGGAVFLAVFTLIQSLALTAPFLNRRFLTDQAVLELLEDCKEEMGIRAFLAVVETPRVKSPALFGFLRPRLLLPSGAMKSLGQERLRHVFLHELAHLKRHDIAVNWMMAILQILHWFNPLVWFAFSRIRADREEACDALVLERIHGEEPGSYGKTIVHLLERFSHRARMPGLAGVIEDKARMKRRIAMIARFRKAPRYLSILGVSLLILVSCISLTDVDSSDHNASRKPSKSSHEKASYNAKSLRERILELKSSRKTLQDVIRIFGEPESYYWGNRKLSPDQLPAVFVMNYPGRFGIVINKKLVSELRHHEAGYETPNGIQVGSSLEEVLERTSKPQSIITGEKNGYETGVLYKDIEGKTGLHYYCPEGDDLRLFFSDNRVLALYEVLEKKSHRIDEKDVRGRDLSDGTMITDPHEIASLSFNLETSWPENLEKEARKILEEAKDPGLGVRRLHQQGITGRGVNVAVIDQPHPYKHPEYKGKFPHYGDYGTGRKTSMHGPAVSSLLVGESCGTAPGARLYYIAVASWNRDAKEYSDALGRILEYNKSLPEGEKIRVVSVSAAPSGPGSPFEKNKKMWEEKCARAEEEGVMVLDCTTHRGFIGPCFYNPTDRTDQADRSDPALYTPGWPGKGEMHFPGKILAPSSRRTTAEEKEKGEEGYIYWGRGGLSWSIPYVAGVLAMGWQIRPDLSPDTMKSLLFESAHVTPSGDRIIHPREFISQVKKSQQDRSTSDRE